MAVRGPPNSSPDVGDRPLLFEPIQLGSLPLPHRIAMAPVTRYSVAEDGCVGDHSLVYYRQRASAAMVIAETSYVHETGRISSYVAGLTKREHIQAWRRITDAVHAEGGLMVAQLMHGGRFSHPTLQPAGDSPLAPSAIAIAPPELVRTAAGDLSTVMPRAMTSADIVRIVEAYGLAASNAVEAGFDAVELHAGNGYLPSQFLSSRSNRRRDGYGGSIERRCRFTLETLGAISASIGGGRTAVKISPFMAMHDGIDLESEPTHRALLRELDGTGLAYVHVQLQFDFQPMLPEPFDPLAMVRGCYTGPIVASGNYDRQSAGAALAEGRCDVVAVVSHPVV